MTPAVDLLGVLLDHDLFGWTSTLDLGGRDDATLEALAVSLDCQQGVAQAAANWCRIIQVVRHLSSLPEKRKGRMAFYSEVATTCDRSVKTVQDRFAAAVALSALEEEGLKPPVRLLVREMNAIPRACAAFRAHGDPDFKAAPKPKTSDQLQTAARNRVQRAVADAGDLGPQAAIAAVAAAVDSLAVKSRTLTALALLRAVVTHVVGTGGWFVVSGLRRADGVLVWAADEGAALGDCSAVTGGSLTATPLSKWIAEHGNGITEVEYLQRDLPDRLPLVDECENVAETATGPTVTRAALRAGVRMLRSMGKDAVVIRGRGGRVELLGHGKNSFVQIDMGVGTWCGAGKVSFEALLALASTDDDGEEPVPVNGLAEVPSNFPWWDDQLGGARTVAAGVCARTLSSAISYAQHFIDDPNKMNSPRPFVVIRNGTLWAVESAASSTSSPVGVVVRVRELGLGDMNATLPGGVLPGMVAHLRGQERVDARVTEHMVTWQGERSAAGCGQSLAGFVAPDLAPLDQADAVARITVDTSELQAALKELGAKRRVDASLGVDGEHLTVAIGDSARVVKIAAVQGDVPKMEDISAWGLLRSTFCPGLTGVLTLDVVPRGDGERGLLRIVSTAGGAEYTTLIRWVHRPAPGKRLADKPEVEPGERRSLPPPLVLTGLRSEVDGRELMIPIGRSTGLPTSNRKLGEDVVVCWVYDVEHPPREAMRLGLDVSTCDACPQRPYSAGDAPEIMGACFVQSVQRAIYGPWKAAKDSIDGVEGSPYLRVTVEEAARHLQGRTLRLPEFGEIAAAPFDMMEPILQTAHIIGYTHRWADPTIDLRWRDHLMASTETVIGSLLARRAGWRTYRIVDHGMPLMVGEAWCLYDRTAPYPTTGLPQRGTRTIQCQDCRWCDGVGQGRKGYRGGVAVVAHGVRKGHWKWEENEIEEKVASAVIQDVDIGLLTKEVESLAQAGHARELRRGGPSAPSTAAKTRARLDLAIDALYNDADIRDAVVAYYRRAMDIGAWQPRALRSAA